MVTTLALVLAALFGAGDQYLGSFSMHPWMADVSLLSAPWLVLAFLAGCTLATAAALCLEPLARISTDRAIRSSTVLLAEVAVGVAMMTYVATKTLMSAQAGQHESSTAR